MLKLKHPNIVKLNEVVYGSALNKIYMVMEFSDFEVKNILQNKNMEFSHSQVKNLVK